MSTNSALQQFAANLRRAIVDHETVKLGGGEFTTTELKPVMVALNAHDDLVAALQRVVDDHDRFRAEHPCRESEYVTIARAALAKVQS